MGPPTIERIDSPAAPGSAEPNLTVGPDGRVYLSWLEPASDSAYALRFAVHDGTRWSPVRTIRSGRDFFVNWADFPSLQVLDSGRLAAHWLERVGRGSYAYGVRIAQSSDAGASWSVPVTPHRDSAKAEHGFVALWPDAGGVGAVWLDGRKLDKTAEEHAPEMMLMSAAISATGYPGNEARLDDRVCDCCQTAAAVTSRGPIVAYRDRSREAEGAGPAEEVRDIYVVRRVAGKWTTPAAVHTDGWRIAACPVNGPAVAANGSRVAVAWFTAANDSARVKVAFSNDAGETFEEPIRVDGGNPAGRVDVALVRDGGALVTWIERIGGDTAAVRVRRIGRDGKPGDPITIANSSAARASGFPRMAVTKDRVLFAWTVPGKPSEVRVARAKLDELR